MGKNRFETSAPPTPAREHLTEPEDLDARLHTLEEVKHESSLQKRRRRYREKRDLSLVVPTVPTVESRRPEPPKPPVLPEDHPERARAFENDHLIPSLIEVIAWGREAKDYLRLRYSKQDSIAAEKMDHLMEEFSPKAKSVIYFHLALCHECRVSAEKAKEDFNSLRREF